MQGYRDGFSVLETLVVVSALTILLGISAVVFTNKEDLLESQQILGGLLTNARLEASASQSEVAVFIRANNNHIESTLMRKDKNDEWKNIRHWLSLNGKVETEFDTENYPNALLKEMHIIFGPNGEVSWNGKEAGKYIIIRKQIDTINTESDLNRTRMIYLSKDTGKVILL